jgi:glutathione S-transferase
MHRVGLNIDKWPNVKAYWERIGSRPKVQEAMQAEGLKILQSA